MRSFRSSVFWLQENMEVFEGSLSKPKDWNWRAIFKWSPFFHSSWSHSGHLDLPSFFFSQYRLSLALMAFSSLEAFGRAGRRDSFLQTQKLCPYLWRRVGMQQDVQELLHRLPTKRKYILTYLRFRNPYLQTKQAMLSKKGWMEVWRD